MANLLICVLVVTFLQYDQCQDLTQKMVNTNPVNLFPTKKVYDKNNKLVEKVVIPNKAKMDEKRNPAAIFYDRKVNIKIMDYCKRYRNESIANMPSQCLEYFLHLRKRNPDFNSDKFGNLPFPKSVHQDQDKDKDTDKDNIVAIMGKDFIDVKNNRKMTHYDLKRERQDKRCCGGNHISTYITELNGDSACDINDLVSGKLAIEYVKYVFRYVETKSHLRKLFETDRFDEIKLMKL